MRGHNFKLGSGGKGANQAVAAARLGINVSMIGMVGEDMFGDSNIKDLSSNGVDTSCVGRTKKTHTATATITVNKEGLYPSFGGKKIFKIMCGLLNVLKKHSIFVARPYL